MSDVIVVALITGGLALAGVKLKGRVDSKASTEHTYLERLNDQNDLVADALGRMQPILSKLNPDGLGFNFNRDAHPQPFVDVVQRLKGVQEELVVLRAKHPLAEMRSAISDLNRTLNRLVGESRLMLDLLAEYEDWRTEREEASSLWSQADESVKTIIDQIIHANDASGGVSIWRQFGNQQPLNSLRRWWRKHRD